MAIKWEGGPIHLGSLRDEHEKREREAWLARVHKSQLTPKQRKSRHELRQKLERQTAADRKAEGKRQYDSLKERLTAKFGGKVGLFLTNRIATIFRKHKFDNVSGWTVIEVGAEDMETLYEIHTCCGWLTEEFIFTERYWFMPNKKRRFVFGICYGH